MSELDPSWFPTLTRGFTHMSVCEQHPGNGSLYTKGLEDFRSQHHSLIDKIRKGNFEVSHDLV